MAIEWREQVAWGYAKNAKPTYSYNHICRTLCNNYDEYYPTAVTSWYPETSVTGWYSTSLSNQNAFGHCDTDPLGILPACEIDLTGPYSGSIITLVFPKAGVRFARYITATSIGGAYTFAIDNRWYDVESGARIYTINEPGWGSSFGWDPGVFNRPVMWACYENRGGTNLIGYCYGSGNQPGTNRKFPITGEFIDVPTFAQYLNEHNPGLDFGTWEVNVESPEAGPASEAGGYGGYGGDITASDSIAVPALPTASAAGLGFINMYNPSAGGLSSLGEEIFPDLEFTSIVDPTGNSVIDAILNACAAFVDCFNQIPKMFEIFINSRLIDYVQDCHIVPVAPTTGTSAHIKLGFRELDTVAPTITTEYVEVDLGTVNVEEFYHMFIDYQPYTRAKLFLPFVGFVPVEPEYWQSGHLGVVYHFNVYDGSFMAFITASPNSKISQMSASVIGQYAGTAVVHLPLTGLNYSSMVAGLVGGTGAAMAAIGSGNVAAGLTAAINTATSSPQVMSSNGYTASAAFMGCRTPFLIIERSVSHFPRNYQHDAGLPSKITTNLASASGFTSISDIDLSSVNATDREKDEIRKLLAEGIYVN